VAYSTGFDLKILKMLVPSEGKHFLYPFYDFKLIRFAQLLWEVVKESI
jgi:hypothetical protein